MSIAVRGQNEASRCCCGGSDDQVVCAARGPTAMDVREQSAVRFCNSQVIGLDRQCLQDLDQELGASPAALFVGELDTRAQLGDADRGNDKVIVRTDDVAEGCPSALGGNEDTGIKDQSAGHAGPSSVAM